MDGLTGFDLEYFIQTRKEIDTEKRERDHILNVAVVVLGALSFAFIQTDKTKEFLMKPQSIALEISTLAILTSLFWTRYMKLRQIADRWYTLYNLLYRYFGVSKSNEYMEGIVIKGFSQARYLKKDVFLCIALSLPIYCLIVITVFNFSFCVLFKIGICLIVIGLHIILTLFLLCRKFKDPYNFKSKSINNEN